MTMNRYLLDTHVFIWWMQDSKQLSQNARTIIADSANEIYISAATVWEMSIKCKLGKLEIKNFSEEFLKKQIIANAFSFMHISLSHSFRIYELDIFHKDPFDHMLIAQAQIENCVIITKDSLFEKYDVDILW
jgi:PIN domain nuclease of toxin-antitoxin system